MTTKTWLRVYAMPFGGLYPAYLKKMETKGRTKAELDEVICWLTGYTQDGLERAMTDGTRVEAFFAEAPAMNPARALVAGVICGERVETIEEPLKREIRTLDKLVDELAKGKAIDKVLRAAG